MKVKIKASENFQECEVVVEVEKIAEITDILIDLRDAIRNATLDIEDKKVKKEDPKKEIKMATEGQIRYLHNLGWSGNESELTFDEASKIIGELGGGKLRGK